MILLKGIDYRQTFITFKIMKIYRAIFKYNNGESSEYLQWCEKYSPWYSSKELAAKHLPLLEKLKDYICFQTSSCNFEYMDPYIEETEVYDCVQTLVFDNIDEDRFNKFEYIPYEGKYEITSSEFENYMSEWVIYLTIDNNVHYLIEFTNYYRKPEFKIKKGYNRLQGYDHTELYYKYDKQTKEKLDSIVNNITNELFRYYKDFAESETKYMRLLDNSKTDNESHIIWVDMCKDKLIILIHIAEKFNLSMAKDYKNTYNNIDMDVFEKSNDFELLKLANEFLSITNENEIKPSNICMGGMKK